MLWKTQGRTPLNSNVRARVYRKYGRACVYCKRNEGNEIDHVQPYWYLTKQGKYPDTLENLVPSCTACNGVVGGKVFYNIADKRDWILKKRNIQSGPVWRRLLKWLIQW